MRVAIYARISTNDGRQDTENQLQELRAWSKRLGGEIVEEYVDHASGARGDRKALQRLLNDSHKRKHEVCLVWALDRLSREGIARMSGYLENLKVCNVRVMSHQEPWLDTAGPVSELLVAIFGWVAKQERERISERIKAGLQRARKTKKLGRPTVDYDIDEIKRLRASGMSTRAIGRCIGVSHVTVARALTN